VPPLRVLRRDINTTFVVKSPAICDRQGSAVFFLLMWVFIAKTLMSQCNIFVSGIILVVPVMLGVTQCFIIVGLRLGSGKHGGLGHVAWARNSAQSHGNSVTVN